MIEQFSHNEDRRINKHEVKELAMWDAVLNPDILSEINLVAEMHPTPEMMFIREAIDKALMNAQKEVWEMYAYDRLPFAEIARKLHISRGAVQRRVKTIERQIVKWCLTHREAYLALKEAEADADSGC